MGQFLSTLIIQNRPGRGGAQTALARLLQHDRFQALDPCLLTSSQGWLTQECQKYGVQYLVEPFPSARSMAARLWGNQAFVTRVAALLDATGTHPRLIHANDHGEALFGASLAAMLRCPSVVTLRSSAMTQADVIKYRIGDCDRIVAVSPDIAETVSSALGDRDVAVIGDGLGAHEFDDPVPLAEAAPGSLLVLGTPQPLKGWEDAVAAIARLESSDGPKPTRYDFAGPTPTAPSKAMQDAMAALPDGRVRFLGTQDGLTDLVRRYQLVLNPSRMESFGLAAVETLAAGVPLLTTNVGVLGDVVQERRMLVPASDPHAIAQALMSIYRNWTGLRESGFGIPESQRKLQKGFHIDQTVQSYEAVYDRVLSKRS